MNTERLLVAAGCLAALAAALFLGACTTTNIASNRTGWSDYATITTKDFEAVGIVRVTSREILVRSMFGIVSSHKGSQITYDMLIGEAKALGGDDIINVRIDRVDETRHSTVAAFEWLFGCTEKYSYTGTALAIRYKDAVPDQERPGHAADSGMGGGPG